MFQEPLKSLTKQLYPTGRVFNMDDESFFSKLNDGLIISENQMHEDIRNVLNVILPDNSNFTSEDATRWETMLGMITNLATDLEDRKAAIIRKLNHPGTVEARQNALYIQEQLQLAGFNVFIHENIPATQILTLSALMEIVQSGQYQSGQIQSGQKIFIDKVANNIDASKDVHFIVGGDNTAVFFVGGEIFGTFANIPTDRTNEFRQLILKLKPVQTVAYLLINYV